MRSIIAIFWVFILLMQSCKSLEIKIIANDIKREISNDPTFNKQFTGLCIYDPKTNKYISHINDELYFTPASNVKILTTLAVLESLGDSIPAFGYTAYNDSIQLLPLADPTFLVPKLNNRENIDWLKSYNDVLFFHPPHTLPVYGSGWAWDDYFYGYQQERSYLPIYENSVSISFDSTLRVYPSFFKDYINVSSSLDKQNKIYRDLNANLFNVWIDTDSSAFFRKIPFKTSRELTEKLLIDTIPQSRFSVWDNQPFSDTLYSNATKQVLTAMMKSSDNFLAEQLLIQSGIVKGQWDVDVFRKELLNNWSTFISNPPKWVDGSGLSRYNLLTPLSMVEVLNKIYEKLSFQEIKEIFPVGGESGTIKNYYKSSTSYIVAKTGTLSNNHNLSGYLITKSNEILIFSFMNNHYLSDSDEIKYAMEKLLIKIRDSY